MAMCSKKNEVTFITNCKHKGTSYQWWTMTSGDVTNKNIYIYKPTKQYQETICIWRYRCGQKVSYKTGLVHIQLGNLRCLLSTNIDVEWWQTSTICGKNCKANPWVLHIYVLLHPGKIAHEHESTTLLEVDKNPPLHADTRAVPTSSKQHLSRFWTSFGNILPMNLSVPILDTLVSR